MSDSSVKQRFEYSTKSGTLMWDISALLIGMSQDHEIVYYDVASLPEVSAEQVNISHVDEVDLSEPIIIVELAERKEIVIDGHHQIFRAKQNGIQGIPAIFLREEEHVPFIEDFDPSIYRVVVSESRNAEYRRITSKKKEVETKKPKHSISAAVIVQNSKNEILLVKGPKRGWEMPGGLVEENESLSEAAIREVKEESGFDIAIKRFCGIYQYKDRSSCNTLFLGELIGGAAKRSEESLDVGFFPIEEVLSKVCWGDFRERIVDSLDFEKQPFLVEKNWHEVVKQNTT